MVDKVHGRVLDVEIDVDYSTTVELDFHKTSIVEKLEERLVRQLIRLELNYAGAEFYLCEGRNETYLEAFYPEDAEIAEANASLWGDDEDDRYYDEY